MNTNKCPSCNHETESAEYLETDNGFASAEICVNEQCPYYDEVMTMV